jgi:hypothetical protein
MNLVLDAVPVIVSGGYLVVYAYERATWSSVCLETNLKP